MSATEVALCAERCRPCVIGECFGVKVACESVFEVELTLPAPNEVVNLGGRVYLRFDHGKEALGMQWYRRVRQLFLSRFHV